MNLRKKVLSLFATSAILIGMTTGVAAAQPTTAQGGDDTNLIVDCPSTTGIKVDVDGSFYVDASANAAYYTASLPGGFGVELDLTCNWSTNFTVSAKIGSFQLTEGTAQPGQVDWIHGGVLQLQNGKFIERVGPNGLSVELDNFPDFPWLIVTGDPAHESTVFPGLTSTDFDVVEDGTLIPIIGVASPGVSTFVWDGELVVLPPNLADGTYTAPLTMTLTVN